MLLPQLGFGFSVRDLQGLRVLCFGVGEEGTNCFRDAGPGCP